MALTAEISRKFPGFMIDAGGQEIDARHPDFNGGTFFEPSGAGDARLVLAAADIEAQSQGKGLVLAGGVWSVPAPNITITSPLRVVKGATIKPASGVTVTINGPFDAGLYQVFDTSAGGTVLLGSGSVQEILPQWWGMKADGVTDDTDAWEAALVAAEYALASAPASYPDSGVGITVKLPRGRPTVRRALVVPEGVTIVGEGTYSTQILVDLGGATEDAFTWQLPAGTTGRYFYGGGLRDLDIFADLTDCRDIVHLDLPKRWFATRARLYGGGRYGLYANQCIDSSLTDVYIIGPTTTGLFVDNVVSVSTTLRARGCYFTSARNGPNVDIRGLGLTFTGSVFESAGTVTPGLTTTPGVRVRYGVATFLGCYWENNAGHDIHVGYEAAADKTSVIVTNPLYRTGASELAGKAFAYADYVDHLEIQGGDLTTAVQPLLISANATAQPATILTTARTVNDPVLASGAHWRSYSNLVLPFETGKTQGASKAAIAVAGTAAFTIPTNLSSVFRAYFEISYDMSSNLRTLVEVRVFREGGFADGGAVVTLIGNDSAGNFQVVAGDFVVTYPTASSVVITYTNNNPVGANTIQAKVEEVFGVAGALVVA